MGKFDGVLDEVYNKQDTKLSSVLDEIYGPEVEPITMVENEPTPIADALSGLGRDIERVSKEPFIRPSIKSDLDIYYPEGLEPPSNTEAEYISTPEAPAQKLFTAPPNQDIVVPEELDLGSMQAVRDRQAMLPPSMPAEPGYVPPAGITEGLEAALPIAYQATKKGISGAVQALAENAPVTSFPTAPIAEYMQGVGEGAQAEIEKTIQEKQIRPGTAGAVATDVASSMAQFLPIAGMSIIAPSVAPAGLAFLATVSGGDKYQRAKEAGFGEGEALAQGIAYGAAEAIGEKIGLDYLLAAAKNPAVMSGVKTIFAQGLKQAGVEGAEEGLTQIIQNATDIVAKKARPETKGEAPTILQDVPYAMGVGAVAGGLTGGGLGTLQSVMAGQEQPQPEAPKEEVQPESPTATEPPPQNMESTTEFLTRKPTVIFGEAERLRGEEIPTGGMTINRQARPTVTFGGEGERTGEAIPEGKGMTVQPTAPTNKLDQLFKREEQESKPTVSTKEQKTMDKLFKSGNIEEKAKADVVGAKMAEELNREEITKQKYSYAKTSGLKNGYAVIHSLIKGDYPQVIADINAGRTNILDVETALNNLTKIDPLSKENNNYFLDKIKSSKTSPQPQQTPKVAPKDIDALVVKQPASKTPQFDFSQETDINKLRTMLDDAVEREDFKPGAESDAILKRIDELENQAIDQVSPELLRRIQDNGVSPEASQRILEKAFLIKKDSIINNPKRMDALLNEYSGIESVVKKTAKIILDDYVKQNFPKADVDGLFSNASPLSREAQTKIIKDAQAKAKAIHGSIKNYFENPVEERTAEPAEPTAVKTPEVKEPWQMTADEFVASTGKKGKDIGKWNEANEKAYVEGKPLAISNRPDWSLTPKEFEQKYTPEDIKYIEPHKDMVRQALAEGKPVPPEVLAEYPDLKVEQKVKTKEKPQKNIIKNEIIDKINVTPPKQIGERSVSAVDGEALLNLSFAEEQTKNALNNGIISRNDFDYINKKIKTFKDRVNSNERGLLPYIEKLNEQIKEATQPRPKTGPGMFGGATVQNAYEKVEPALKKGADMLFKKGKQAYEAAKRNADLTRDMGRVVDITEKEGRPVETEPPIRPRIGMFGAGTIQDIYEKIVGKKQTSNEKITIGDPNIAKKIDDAYDATDKIEMDTKKDAEKMRQTVGGAARQSMIDLFAPYLDLVKKDPARYEQALKRLHDVFYIPSEVEGFLNDYRDQILAPIKKAGKTYRDYSAYRMAKWILTGRAKVKSKLTLPEAQQFIDSVDPQTRKLFEDITTNFHEKTWKSLLKLLKDSGLKDDKVINFIMDKENYSPFFPAKQMGLSYGSREYKPSGEIFKLTEKGYEGDIQDILTSLLQKGISMLTHANINMAKLEGINILKTMAPKSITKAKPSYKGVKKLKDSNGQEIEVPIMEFDEPASNSQMALLTVRENGKAKGYYVPKQFAEAFDNALGDPSSFADSLRYYSNLTQTIKNVWIDYNPPWQLFTNMVRDIPAAAIEMPGFKKPIKFVGKVVKKAPAAIGDYVKFIGEVGQQITGYDRKAFEKQVTQLLKEKKLLSSKDVQHLGDYNITVFDRIQNAFDTFPKEGESQGFLQQLKAFGKDVERLTKVAFDETLQESGEFTQDEIKNMTRRGGSPAFGVRGGGKAFEVIKVPLMFYNAVKEGWRAGKYFYQKDPVGFLIKASVPLSIFSFGAAAATGAFGDEWKKAYLAIKKSDRENKLVYPLWWTDEGNIKYLALSVPQFLKPFMIMINELASSNPSLAEGLADAMSNEMPSLNPILDIGKSLLAYGANKPPVDRFGNPIMTQDQWTAGGSEKAIAMLKSISNQNLFGSYFKFPIKPSDKKKDWLETFYDASFGKIMKESFAPAIDTEEQDVNAAKARLLARQIIEIEKENPEEANRLRDEMRKLGYTPSRQFMRSIRRETNIEREKEAGTITDREAYEKRLRQQPKTKRKKYNELFKK